MILVAKDWDIPTIIKNCSTTGFEHIELRTTHAHRVEVTLSKDQRREVRKRFEDAGLKISLASGFGYHYPDPAELRENIEGTKEYTILAQDLGAIGIYYMDGCRWGLGQNTLPAHVMSLGGRFGYEDDGQTPNTQIIFLDYEPAPIIFEVRGLPKSKSLRKDDWRASDMDEYGGMQIGTIIRCEGGTIACDSGRGTTARDNSGKVIKKFEPTTPDLRTNFLDAIRSRRTEDLVTPVLQGHLSAALVHLGNISYRLGKETPGDEAREAVKGEKALAETLDRFLAHLDANETDLKKTPIRMGPMLTFDPQQERSTGPFSDSANMFISRNYREPFVVPEKV